MVVLKNYFKALMLIYCTLIFGCDRNQSPVTFATSENEVLPPPPPPPSMPEIKEHIVYRDFVLEDSFQNGIRFGMLASEWNKQLALLTKNGWFNNLHEETYYVGSVRFSSVYDELNNEGYSVEGIFIKPTIRKDTIEVFRRNGNEIHEPVLIGIKYNYRINPSNVTSYVNTLLNQNNLSYLAGVFPIQANSAPIKVSEFERPWQHDLAVIKNDRTELENCRHEKSVSNLIKNETLFKNDQFYTVVTWTEKTTAQVLKDDKCFITQIFSGKRELSFSLTMYSKKQANLKVDDYLTYDQKSKIESDKKTQDLIKKALE